MPTTETAEFYFIAGAFVLIFIVCAAATFVFFRQLKRERPDASSDATTENERQDPDGEEE